MAGERVLITDDEAGVRRFLQRVLQRQGYDIVAVGDGASALAALEASQFDVCLTDLRLPDMSGIDVLERAKQLYPDTEVIILTGHGDLGTAIEALRLGAYDYLQKPIVDLEIIRISISRALERQRMARRNKQLLHDLAQANQELEARRRKQLQYINYVGEALSAALHAEDIAQVFVQATLEMVGCEGAGLLLLAPYYNSGHALILGGRNKLSAGARDALVDTLHNTLAEHLRPPRESFDMLDLSENEGGPTSQDSWEYFQTALLLAHDQPIGVAMLASTAEESPGEEALGLFHFLVTQTSIALENARLFARANELATRDGVTGLYNHRHFFELLDAEISRAERHDQELAVIMLDIDRQGGLKMVNNAYGHLVGDEFLQKIGEFLLQNVRRADVLARYGGDEFVVLAPQTLPLQAQVLAERICTRLANQEFIVAGHEMHVTASLGVAAFVAGQNEDGIGLVRAADRALYAAKESGGNRVCMAEADVPATL